MILLQRWSDRIFSHQNTLFSENMSVQNKNLKFLSLVFWKINLSKLTLFFQIFHVILKLIKQLTDFSKFWTLKKKNTCKPMPFFIIFKMPMKELKIFNLSYHFL